MRKRMLSVVLVIVFLLSMLPYSVYASKREEDVAANNEIVYDVIESKGTSVYLKAIVVIPGIMGSTLKYGSTVAWMGTAWDKLKLNENGTSVNTITSVNDYGVLSMYEPLMTSLNLNFSSLGYDVIFFDYDWRLDNSHTASLLESELSMYSEVVLVCHSMGGLVASKFLKNSSANRNKTVAMITLGTPFLGSAKTIGAMETGELLPFGTPNVKDLVKLIAGNSKAAYELIPTTRYLYWTGTYPLKINGAGYYQDCYSKLTHAAWGKTSTGSVKTQFDIAESFHNSLGTDLNHIIHTGDVAVYTFGGNGVSTPATAVLNSDYTLDQFTTSQQGDGTVLLSSAGLGSVDYTCPSTDHLEILGNQTVINQVVSIINTEIGVSSANSNELMTLSEQENMVQYNERGWMLGKDNRRITIITEGNAEILLDGKPITISAESVFDDNGKSLGVAWCLSKDGRYQYELIYGNYTVICDDFLRVLFSNDGYYLCGYEYNNCTNKIVTITGFDHEVTCSINRGSIMPSYVFSAEDLEFLNS